MASFARATQLSSADLLRDPSRVLNRSTLTDMLGGEQECGEAEGSSPISLRINTSISVTQDNNLVCITDSPEQQAKAIAHAVVRAMQENSSGGCGIPMIDEDGRPRPINIEVDASVAVEGSGNVVGSEAVVNEALLQRRRSPLRRQRDETDAEDDSAASAKRRCMSSSS